MGRRGEDQQNGAESPKPDTHVTNAPFALPQFSKSRNGKADQQGGHREVEDPSVCPPQKHKRDLKDQCRAEDSKCIAFAPCAVGGGDVKHFDDLKRDGNDEGADPSDKAERIVRRADHLVMETERGRCVRRGHDDSQHGREGQGDEREAHPAKGVMDDSAEKKGKDKVGGINDRGSQQDRGKGKQHGSSEDESPCEGEDADGQKGMDDQRVAARRGDGSSAQNALHLEQRTDHTHAHDAQKHQMNRRQRIRMQRCQDFGGIEKHAAGEEKAEKRHGEKETEHDRNRRSLLERKTIIHGIPPNQGLDCG